MNSHFVHVDDPAANVNNYCRVFTCKLCDLYKEVLADNMIRSKLLWDVHAHSASTYEVKYLNNEPNTVWELLVELQRRLETSSKGYFICNLNALNNGVSFN